MFAEIRQKTRDYFSKSPKTAQDELRLWLKKYNISSQKFSSLSQSMVNYIGLDLVRVQKHLLSEIPSEQMKKLSFKHFFHQSQSELISDNTVVETASFGLLVDKTKVGISEVYTGQFRSIFDFDQLRSELDEKMKHFTNVNEIFIYHSHPYTEGIGLAEGKIYKKFHPLSLRDIKTLLNLHMIYKIPITLEAHTRS
ncbi:MAG: hypothetical protein ACPGJV_16375, partial [Bacteriovoracaceae bacterium]